MQVVDLMASNRMLLAFVACLCVINVSNAVTLGKCNFTTRGSIDPKAMTMLAPLSNKVYTAESGKYKYTVTLCGAIEDFPNAGSVQTELTGSPPNSWVLGRLNDAELMYGDEWLALTYSSGDPYRNACSKEDRQVTIMVMCDPEAVTGTLRFIHEEAEKNKSSDCTYLFELDLASVCSADLKVSCSSLTIGQQSIGFILVVSFCSIVAAYLLVGVAYKHFVVGATGLEKLPNYDLWRNFGELQADGCDFVCRTGNLGFSPLSISADDARESAQTSGRATAVTQQPGRTASAPPASRQYRGQAPRGAYETEAERDANILPM